MKTEKFLVKGMGCSKCVEKVEKTVSSLNGVKKVKVELETKSMVVNFDETLINHKMIVKSVNNIGYKAK